MGFVVDKLCALGPSVHSGIETGLLEFLHRSQLLCVQWRGP